MLHYTTPAIIAVVLIISGCKDQTTDDTNNTKVLLGKALFSDTSLSLNRTMSCTTCHELDHAMIDPRTDSLTFGASRGDDSQALGDRNTPTASYALFSPEFHFDNTEGLFIGGQFLDGRAKNLKEQAKAPFLNPIEMMMPDEASVIERIKENEDYITKFQNIYGNDIFTNTQKAYDALADAIASFESTQEFAPFDSKFDKVNDGNTTFSAQEQRGLALFNGKAQCNLCHSSDGDKPLFTDFSYDNLGIPVNELLRAENNKGSTFIDTGLFYNPDVNDTSLKGAFKVSGLRNIAVTAPYMHNGVFKNLKTVVHFYNTRDVPGAINPETGSPWRSGEVDINKNTEELGNLGLSDTEEDDLVAFLRTLTDAKYEHLMVP